MDSRFRPARLIAALVLSAGACTSALAQTGADTCATASSSVIPATGGVINGQFLGGAADGGFAIDCEATGALASGSDVFFSFTPSNAGPWIFATCASTAVDDTILSVHTGCPANAGNAIACDDDTDGCGAIDFLSRTDAVSLTPGVTYIVRVARWSGSGTQAFVLDVTSLSTSGACCDNSTGACTTTTSTACTVGSTFLGVGSTCSPSPCPPPSNDECSGAVVAVVGLNSGSNASATTNAGDGHTCQLTANKGVWFTFTAPSTGDFRFDTEGSAQPDTVVSIFDACGGTEIGCDDDSGTGLLSSLPLSLTSGQVVKILVSSYGAAPAGGQFNLNISSITIPANDACAGALPLTLGTSVSSTMTNAGGVDLTVCSGSTVDLWYAFTPATSGNYEVVTTPDTANDWSTAIAVFNPGCDPAANSEIACAPQLGLGATNQVVASLTAGTTYLIRAGVFAGDQSNFSIVINQNVTSGACCTTAGGCSVVASTACTGTSVYQGDGTVCDPSPCPPSGACCDPVTGSCSVGFQSACASPNTFQGTGTTCTPNPCPQPPPPANDNCFTPTIAAIGSNPGTFAGATNDGDATCDGATPGNDVYFSFTPAVTSGYRLSLCDGLNIDTALSVHTGCIADTTNELGAGCDDDTCAFIGLSQISSIVLNAGTTYTIRVALFSSTTVPANFDFTLAISTVQAGACCGIAGGCFVTAPGDCVDGPVYQGDNTTCDPSPCPVTGSCCFPSSALCFTAIQAYCDGVSGIWTSGGACDPNPCAGSTPGNDACSNATPVTSLPFVSNVGTDLAQNEGPVPSAGACNAAGAAAEGLDNSIFYSYTATFTGDLRVRHTNYGTYDALLVVYSGTDCNALTEIDCQDEPEPYDFTLPVTAGTTYYFGIGDWGTADGGGWNTFRLDQVGGAGNIACCRGATCSVTTAAACTDPTGTAGAFATTATACNSGSSTTPCCYADFNKVGGITVQDIFDFLNDWFAGSNFADTGGDGSTAPDVQSIFDFLNAWFAGGC